MDKGLFFLILSILLFWVILDDFFGKKHVSNLARNIAPTWNPVGSFVEKKKEQYKEAAEQEHDSFLGKQQREFFNKYGPA